MLSRAIVHRKEAAPEGVKDIACIRMGKENRCLFLCNDGFCLIQRKTNELFWQAMGDVPSIFIAAEQLGCIREVFLQRLQKPALRAGFRRQLEAELTQDEIIEKIQQTTRIVGHNTLYLTRMAKLLSADQPEATALQLFCKNLLQPLVAVSESA